MKPVIALVGRPNVGGNPRCFNRLTRRATRSLPTCPASPAIATTAKGAYSASRPYLRRRYRRLRSPSRKTASCTRWRARTRRGGGGDRTSSCSSSTAATASRRKTSRSPTICARPAGRFSSSSTRREGMKLQRRRRREDFYELGLRRPARDFGRARRRRHRKMISVDALGGEVATPGQPDGGRRRRPRRQHGVKSRSSGGRTSVNRRSDERAGRRRARDRLRHAGTHARLDLR